MAVLMTTGHHRCCVGLDTRTHVATLPAMAGGVVGELVQPSAVAKSEFIHETTTIRRNDVAGGSGIRPHPHPWCKTRCDTSVVFCMDSQVSSWCDADIPRSRGDRPGRPGSAGRNGRPRISRDALRLISCDV